MWQREFIITNTLGHKMIYSARSLLFSLTVNGFDFVKIPLACSSSPSISPAWSLSSFVSDLIAGERSKGWTHVGARQPGGEIIILVLAWAQDQSLLLPWKLYSSSAVIQLHRWPWSYCWRLNGVSKITVNAPTSSRKGPQRLSHSRTSGTLSACCADSCMNIWNACIFI